LCHLYSVTKGQQAIRVFGGRHARPDRQSATAVRDLPGLLRPDCPKPTRRSRADDGAVGDALPVFALKGKNSDPGVTNDRNVKSPHWRRWLGIENRCVAPWASFSENEVRPDGSRPTVWFTFDETRPLAFFAGIWTRRTSLRKVKEGETTNDIFAFLTTEPNREIGAIHPKAMPVVLTAREEIDVWMNAPAEEASRGDKQDEGGGASRPDVHACAG
jgi:putative SOS response-associated peptidase YedK